MNKGENYYRGAGTKGDKYHDGDRKMDAIWLKVRITTKVTGTWTIKTGTGPLVTGRGTFETGKKWILEALLSGLNYSAMVETNGKV